MMGSATVTRQSLEFPLSQNICDSACYAVFVGVESGVRTESDKTMAFFKDIIVAPPRLERVKKYCVFQRINHYQNEILDDNLNWLQTEGILATYQDGDAVPFC